MNVYTKQRVAYARDWINSTDGFCSIYMVRLEDLKTATMNNEITISYHKHAVVYDKAVITYAWTSNKERPEIHRIANTLERANILEFLVHQDIQTLSFLPEELDTLLEFLYEFNDSKLSDTNYFKCWNP